MEPTPTSIEITVIIVIGPSDSNDLNNKCNSSFVIAVSSERRRIMATLKMKGFFLLLILLVIMLAYFLRF